MPLGGCCRKYVDFFVLSFLFSPFETRQMIVYFSIIVSTPCASSAVDAVARGK
jgi:hypothetical protein